MKKAISILSGGLDSTVASSFYSNDYEIHAITFNYGQKSLKQEIKASKLICEKMGFTHEIIKLPWLKNISKSSLTSDKKVINVNEKELDNIEKSKENAMNVWVPGRNLVFTSIAESYAESLDAEIIIVGWDKEEANSFPDNSKEFLEKFNETINIGSPYNIEIKAPLIDLNKEEIVKLGFKLNSPMELSYSCYNNNEKHCGVCESCVRRKRAFKKANIKDLTEYEK